jgi:hypothetical protein
MAEADARVEAAAFRVLSPGARRVLAAIMSEIGEAITPRSASTATAGFLQIGTRECASRALTGSHISCEMTAFTQNA